MARDDAKPLAQVCNRVELSGVASRQRHGEKVEADEIDRRCHHVRNEAVADTHRADDDAGDRRRDDAAEAGEAGVEAEHLRQVFGRNDRRNQALACRLLDAHQEAAPDARSEDREHGEIFGQRQRAEHQRIAGVADLRQQQNPSLAVGVGDTDAEQTEDRVGPPLKQGDQTDLRGGVGQRVDDPGQHRRLKPESERADRADADQQPVGLVGEQRQRGLHCD